MAKARSECEQYLARTQMHCILRSLVSLSLNHALESEPPRIRVKGIILHINPWYRPPPPLKSSEEEQSFPPMLSKSFR